VEVDGVDESGDASESVGLLLDGLDFVVDALGAGVAQVGVAQVLELAALAGGREARRGAGREAQANRDGFLGLREVCNGPGFLDRCLS
jgi:hypothetical protein